MPTLVNDEALPVLEPLSKATGQMMAPIPLFKNDFLLLDLDADGSRFVVTPVTMRQYDPDRDEVAPSDIIKHAGIRFVITTNAASYNLRKKLFSRIPERREIGDKWLIAATDVNALILHHAIPHARIVFRSDDARIVYLHILRRFLSQTSSSRLIADYKVNGSIPTMPSDFIEHPERPLLPYQRVGLLACLHRDAFALFMEQGTGKTAVSINRVCLEAARKRAGKLPNRPDVTTMYRVLVLCPNQVRTNWAREFENFATIPGKVTVLRGGKVRRCRNLVDGIRDEKDCAWSATIASIDSTESMSDYYKRVDWDLVIIDESHYIKNNRAKRTRAVLEMRQFPFVHQCMILTGTPIANSAMDLWAQFEAMDQGMSGFRTYEAFRRFYGVFKKLDAQQQGHAVEKLVGIKNAPLLQERLARTSFLLSKKEARLNLPDKSWDIYEVQMTPVQRDIYRKMANHLAVQLGDIEDKTMTADHVLTMLLRLAQITAGHVKWDKKIDPETLEVIGEGQVEQIEGGNPKVDACIEMLKDEGRDENGKTIIWCIFREDIRAISERLASEGIGHRVYHGKVSQADREEAVQAFNEDPSVRVFVANPATAAEGLNLVGYDWWNSPPRETTYTDHEIFFSCDWSATKRSQAEDRAHRKGTRQPVRITDLCVPGTVDEEIRARVLRKRKNALAIQDVRDIMKRVLNMEDMNGDD